MRRSIAHFGTIAAETARERESRRANLRSTQVPAPSSNSHTARPHAHPAETARPRAWPSDTATDQRDTMEDRARHDRTRTYLDSNPQVRYRHNESKQRR